MFADISHERQQSLLRQRNLLDDPQQEATFLWNAYIEKVIA